MSIIHLECPVVVFLLVILWGDVSENPGPENSNSSSQTCNSMSIIHLNIRSIRNKLDYNKENFSDFDIFCFIETRLANNVNKDDTCIEGFYLIPYSKDVTAHLSRILVYISNGLITNRKPKLEIYLEEFIWIEIKHKGKSILLSTIYRIPNIHVSFNLEVEKGMKVSNIIYVGDLNEDLFNCHNHHLK